MGAWQWAKKLPFYVLLHVSPHKNATKPLIGQEYVGVQRVTMRNVRAFGMNIDLKCLSPAVLFLKDTGGSCRPVALPNTAHGRGFG